MRRTPLTLRESRLQFAGRTTFALALLTSVTLAWGRPPQEKNPAEDGTVPFLSDIPLLSSQFQEKADPTDENGVPFLSDLPLLGSLFQAHEDPREDEKPDPGPPAGEFDVVFSSYQLSDLLELQRQCAVEGGQMVITAIRNVESGAGAIEGRCRVFDLTVEGKNRFLHLTPENQSPYPDHNPGGPIYQIGSRSRPVQPLPPELAALFSESRTQPLSEKQLADLKAHFAQGPPPEFAVLCSEIQHLERRLAQLELERIDLESALASKRHECDVLLGKDRPGTRAGAAAPAIRGMVLLVADTANGQIVAINRGSNEGVEIGTIFEIYRESTYKGRVEVTEVQADTSFGKILLAPWPMSPGDQATTKL